MISRINTLVTIFVGSAVGSILPIVAILLIAGPFEAWKEDTYYWNITIGVITVLWAPAVAFGLPITGLLGTRKGLAVRPITTGGAVGIIWAAAIVFILDPIFGTGIAPILAALACICGVSGGFFGGRSMRDADKWWGAKS